MNTIRIALCQMEVIDNKETNINSAINKLIYLYSNESDKAIQLA